MTRNDRLMIWHRLLLAAVLITAAACYTKRPEQNSNEAWQSFALMRDGRISGHVIPRRGVSLENARVEVIEENGIYTLEVDSSGYFSIDRLYRRRYYNLCVVTETGRTFHRVRGPYADGVRVGAVR